MNNKEHLRIYKFLVNNSEQLEIRERAGRETEYLAWVYLWAVQDLTNLLNDLGVDFSTNSIVAHLGENTICIDLANVLPAEDLEEIFKED